MHSRAFSAHRIIPAAFILVLTIAGFAAQLHVPTLLLAQKSGKRQLKAQQVPAIHTALPKARLHGVKRDPSNSLKLYSFTAQGLKVSEDAGRSWQALAIGGAHKEVFAFAGHPANPDILYAGRRDGLWKSRDGGQSWSPLPYPASVPLSIAIAKSDSDVLYLATARQGVHKSTDGGYQWGAVSKGLPEARAGRRPEEIRTLVVDPLDSNIVYAALARHGVYRTTDGGASWHKFDQGLPFLMVRPIRAPKLAFDPDNPQRLYLAFNEKIHSHLVRTRLYVLSDIAEWLPLEVELPPNFPVLDLVVDGFERTLQIWGQDAVWELPLLGKGGANP